MGGVVIETASAINEDENRYEIVQGYINSYLRRKIDDKPSRKGYNDDLESTEHRLTGKYRQLEEKIDSLHQQYCGQIFKAFLGNLRHEIAMYRTCRATFKAYKGWNRLLTNRINKEHKNKKITLAVEAFLFGHIDVHSGLETNLDLMRAMGAQMMQATFTNRETAQRVLNHYLEPQYLNSLLASKCKGEYSRKARRCANEINSTDDPHFVQFIMLSYFWEKLKQDKTVEWNQVHQHEKLENLLRRLKRYPELARQVHQEVVQRERLDKDIAWKQHIEEINDYMIKQANNSSIAPPPTSSRRVSVAAKQTRDAITGAAVAGAVSSVASAV